MNTFLKVLFIFAFLLASCSPGKSSSLNQLLLKDPEKIGYTLALGDASPFSSKIVTALKINGLNSAGAYLTDIQDKTTGKKLGDIMLHLLKGKALPPTPNATFLVMSNLEGSRWFKVSPSANLNAGLIEGYKALLVETKLLGISIPSMRVLTILGQQYMAYEMPYYGPTLLTSGIVNGRFTAEGIAIYKSAFHNAVSLLVNEGILLWDPNPGNIIKVMTPNGPVGLIIDFEAGKGISQKPTRTTITGLLARFNTWNDFYRGNIVFEVPQDLASLIINPAPNMSVGRIFLADGVMVDYAVSLKNLNEKSAASIKKQIVNYVKNNFVYDDVIIVDGVEVTLTKKMATSIPILKAAADTRFFISPGMLNVAVLMSLGTFELKGWDGPAINIPMTFDATIEHQRIEGDITYDELWDQVQTYKGKLVLYARGGTVSDDWITNLAEPSEVSYYLTNMLGMKSYDFAVLLQDDLHLDATQINEVMTETIYKSDLPLGMKFKFSSGAPGFDGSDISMPLWVSAATDQDGSENMVIWAQTYESMFGLSEPALMPMVVAKKIDGAWNTVMQDAERELIGFIIKDVTPASNVQCMIVGNGNVGLQTRCWFVQK